MRDWYLRQSPRDRLIILVVAALVLFSAVYLLLWDPLKKGIEQRQSNLDGMRSNIQFIRDGGQRIRAAGGATNPSAANTSKAPYLLIDEVIRSAGVNPPQRIEPDGKNGARVQFSEVEFDKLIGIIAVLESQGLVMTTINLSARETGYVSARFNMERG